MSRWPNGVAGRRSVTLLRPDPCINLGALNCNYPAEERRMKSLPMIGLVMAAAFCAAQANAQELAGTLKKVKEKGTITIGYRDSSIPFSYLDDNQKPIGLP